MSDIPDLEVYVDTTAGGPETACVSAGFTEVGEVHSIQGVCALMDRLLRESPMSLENGERANLPLYAGGQFQPAAKYYILEVHFLEDKWAREAEHVAPIWEKLNHPESFPIVVF